MINTEELFKHGFDEFEVHEFTNYQWECECPILGG